MEKQLSKFCHCLLPASAMLFCTMTMLVASPIVWVVVELWDGRMISIQMNFSSFYSLESLSWKTPIDDEQ